jgi:hypothetical protein
MREDHLYFGGTAVLGLALMFLPGPTRALERRHLNLSFEGNAESCAALRARSSGEVAQAAEQYTLSRAEAPVLEIHATTSESAGHGVIKVRGADRPDYSVEVCKVAAGENRAEAEQVLRGISTSRLGGRISTNGPAAPGEWQVFFIVHAPRDGNVDLETANGPIGITDVGGSIKARTSNGPLSLQNCGGSIDAHTTNGPISFSGTGGDVHLNTTNGPVSLKLAGDVWSGPRLEARTTNGPVSLSVPDTFQSSVRLETDGRSPMGCRIAACRQAVTNNTTNQKVMQINGSSETVRVSTSNGPVSVGGPAAGKKVI